MDTKYLRKKLDLSQDQLSAETGIPKARIGGWERGKGKPKTADSEILKKFFTDKGVWEDKPKERLPLDLGEAVAKIDLKTDIMLSLVVELLAQVTGKPFLTVKQEVDDLIQKHSKA